MPALAIAAHNNGNPHHCNVGVAEQRRYLHVNQLVDASDSPLSVVIVGVGSADFSAMEALDGDGGVLKSSKFKAAKRDIVQFVPFSKYAMSPSRLAGETLAEIPHQVIQYMTSKGIKHEIVAASENRNMDLAERSSGRGRDIDFSDYFR